MKIQSITKENYSISNQQKNLPFKAYKPLGKVILTSGGIASAAIASAFLDAPQEDIVEVSTVKGDSEQSKAAYNKLIELITNLKNNNVKPVSRDKYRIDYIEPKKSKSEEEHYEDPTDSYDYLAKRIYCYSDMI